MSPCRRPRSPQAYVPADADGDETPRRRRRRRLRGPSAAASPPAHHGAVGAPRAGCAPVAGVHGDEAPRGRVGEHGAAVAPTGDRVVGAQTAGVRGRRRRRGESPARRRQQILVVDSPAHDAAAGTHPAGQVSAGADRGEPPGGRVRLAAPVRTPAHHRAVGAQPAGMRRATAERREPAVRHTSSDEPGPTRDGAVGAQRTPPLALRRDRAEHAVGRRVGSRRPPTHQPPSTRTPQDPARPAATDTKPPPAPPAPPTNWRPNTPPTHRRANHTHAPHPPTQPRTPLPRRPSPATHRPNTPPSHPGAHHTNAHPPQKPRETDPPAPRPAQTHCHPNTPPRPAPQRTRMLIALRPTQLMATTHRHRNKRPHRRLARRGHVGHSRLTDVDRRHWRLVGCLGTRGGLVGVDRPRGCRIVATRPRHHRHRCHNQCQHRDRHAYDEPAPLTIGPVPARLRRRVALCQPAGHVLPGPVRGASRVCLVSRI